MTALEPLSPDWQTIAAVALVALAAAHILYRAVRTALGARSNCGHCGSCTSQPPLGPQLVQLEMPTPKPSRKPA